MSSLKQFLRQMIVVICGLSFLGSMLGMPAGAMATMMRGGHGLAAVEHEGHQDLILLHRDADEVAACVRLAARAGHHFENHTYHLASSESTFVPLTKDLQAPTAAALISFLPEFVIPRQNPWSSAKLHPRPPPRLNGVMICLRTTVLVV